MKDHKKVLVPIDVSEIPKQAVVLVPEKKSDCGKCKECKCRPSAHITVSSEDGKKKIVT